MMGPYSLMRESEAVHHRRPCSDLAQGQQVSTTNSLSWLSQEPSQAFQESCGLAEPDLFRCFLWELL